MPVGPHWLLVVNLVARTHVVYHTQCASEFERLVFDLYIVPKLSVSCSLAE